MTLVFLAEEEIKRRSMGHIFAFFPHDSIHFAILELRGTPRLRSTKNEHLDKSFLRWITNVDSGSRSTEASHIIFLDETSMFSNNFTKLIRRH